MSDTPRTDEEILDPEIVHQDSHSEGWVSIDFARQLERELASVAKGSLELEEERDELDREFQDLERRANSLERELIEAQHRIRALIEERDSARIQAEHKWKLREEFEALLGTDDVSEGVKRIKELMKKANR